MKKIKLLFAVMALFAVGLIASCKKDTLLTYSIADNIYFRYAPSNNLASSATITFGYSPLSVTDSTFKIPVTITGTASSTDRTYNILVDTGTTAVAGKHYVLPTSFVFRKNLYTDTLKVKFLRTADEKTAAVSLRLTLQPTNDLHTDLKILTVNNTSTSVNTFKMYISDILVKDPTYYDNSFAPYFGVWSAKKMYLINQITGMPLNYLTILAFYDAQYTAKLSYYAITMTNYLNAQKAAGHTVYEDDGTTVMTMGPNYQ